MKKTERGVRNYNHFYYFYVSFQYQTTFDAARKLKTSRNSLTRQINKLEKEIGIKLYSIVKGKRVMTPAGEEIWQECRFFFGQFKAVEITIKKCKKDLNRYDELL